jgi:beta-galactosidase/beta-glucuronidase
MTPDAAPLHPRPQFARRQWIDLRGTWQFAYDDHAVGVNQHWFDRDDVFDRRICVPFPPESTASGIGDTGFHPIMWYRRTFTVDSAARGHPLLLHFGAVDYIGHVWVNGRRVATHEGGQTPFYADIASALVEGDEQVVTVRAEDPPSDLALPRGKQDWLQHPHNIWYDRTSGIWQPVWLEPVSSPYIVGLQWPVDLDRGTVGVAITLTPHHGEVAEIRVELRLHDQLLIDDTFHMDGTDARRDITLDLGSLTMSRERVLWSPGSPNLMDATVTVSVAGRVTDQVESYVGLRSVGAAGGRFLLNGRPYYLRLALEQGFWPESHLAAPSDEAIRREVELARELGFNGVRIHQKVEDPRFLYWCDRLGLMVWGEMADPYVFNTLSASRMVREWLEVLSRDFSHPCIVAWVPINESWGVPNLLANVQQRHFVEAMYHITKSMDATRPVIGNDGWEFLVGDLFGIHDYGFSGDVLRNRYSSQDAIRRLLREVQPSHRFVLLDGEVLTTDIPFILSEFGGISYRPRSGETWFGYGTVDSAEEFAAKYQELVSAVLACTPIAGFCYTQLTDTQQETNGLLTADRQFKIDPEIIRAITRQPAQAVPGDIVNDLRRKAGTNFGGSASAATKQPSPKDS